MIYLVILEPQGKVEHRQFAGPLNSSCDFYVFFQLFKIVCDLIFDIHQAVNFLNGPALFQ